ncbi:WecB/TagA/CpsF family glycosyltransferase [Melioribacter sp. OK-6-Me]|uniref:WecB/TagA/CpsF family glycosyltransferase n=1 Tax=unclassified Melioribacter TaxID=2627329 RepID=UPI003ED8C8CC
MKLIIGNESINLITKESDFIEIFAEELNNQKDKIITYINMNTINLLYENNEYLRFMSKECLCMVEGTGMWLSLLCKNVRTKRVLFTDVLLNFFKIICKRKMKLYFIGGNYNVELLHKKIYPLKLSGYLNGYSNKYDWSSIVEELNKADLIMIGMGQPRQEIMAIELKSLLNEKHIICCGAFMDYYTGVTRRAPSLLRNCGMEWLYRIYDNPQLYWKRYLIGIPKFIFRAKGVIVEK